MVQRKAPAGLERRSSSQQVQHDTRSNGSGALKKKLKMERSIMAADLESLCGFDAKPNATASPPNYMKPTSSSNARAERMQVKRTIPKTLIRQPSLKGIRSLMKKNQKGAALNRATCSSTLKDSKFPKALDLSPGGTEAEGTSVMKVCPYSYCSLNGHRHEPLPPLKSFVSARRILLKTQKSMKLRGLSSFRVEGVGKDTKGIDTGQKAPHRCSSGLKITLPTEDEESNDFFTEIYTETPELISESGECVDQEIREDEHPNDPYSYIGCEDYIDWSSELSDEGMDVLMSFLEYVESDQRVPDGFGELHTESWQVDASGKESDDKAEAEKATTFELGWEDGVESPFPDSKTECSECFDEDFGLPTLYNEPLPVEKTIFSDECETAGDEEELPRLVIQEAAEDDDFMPPIELTLDTISPITYDERLPEVDDEVAENDDAMGLHCGSVGCGDADSNEELCGFDVSNLNSELDEPESSSRRNYDLHGSLYIANSVLKDFHEAASDEQGENTETEDALCREDNVENVILKPDGPEVRTFLVKEKSEEDEGAEDVNSLSIAQLFDSCDYLPELQQATKENNELEIQSNKCNGETEEIHNPPDAENCAFDDKSDYTKVNLEGSQKEQQKDSIDPDLMKARLRITRKKMIEHLEETKEFNPRGPRFLEVEADPEAEKVDLRHQMMDERKNSEEWMIDYALRRALMRMAPARKKKVALLVEAFETVAPLPAWEKPSRHAASDLTHARIIQACN